MAKQPKTAPANSINDQEPIGMVDGELKTYAPGEAIPGPTVLDEDGDEVNADDLKAEIADHAEEFGDVDEEDDDED